MNREEAAKMIKDDIRLHHDDLSGKYRHALNMAIEALRQPEIVLCEDCEYWDRESCIDGFCNESWIHVDEDHYCGFAKRKEE